MAEAIVVETTLFGQFRAIRQTIFVNLHIIAAFLGCVGGDFCMNDKQRAI